MADVRLFICGRHYDVNCADGQEDQLLGLAKMIDERARSVGGGTETRQLLYAALMLADEAQEARSKSGSNPPAIDTAALRAEADALKASETEAREALRVAEARIKLMESSPPVAVQVSPGMSRALEQIADRIEGLAVKLAPQG